MRMLNILLAVCLATAAAHDPKIANVVLADAEGHVVWQSRGPATEGKTVELESMITKLSGQKSPGLATKQSLASAGLPTAINDAVGVRRVPWGRDYGRAQFRSPTSRPVPYDSTTDGLLK